MDSYEMRGKGQKTVTSKASCGSDCKHGGANRRLFASNGQHDLIEREVWGIKRNKVSLPPELEHGAGAEGNSAHAVAAVQSISELIGLLLEKAHNALQKNVLRENSQT
jgi:hypothetical protein